MIGRRGSCFITPADKDSSGVRFIPRLYTDYYQRRKCAGQCPHFLSLQRLLSEAEVRRSVSSLPVSTTITIRGGSAQVSVLTSCLYNDYYQRRKCAGQCPHFLSLQRLLSEAEVRRSVSSLPVSTMITIRRGTAQVSVLTSCLYNDYYQRRKCAGQCHTSCLYNDYYQKRNCAGQCPHFLSLQ